MRHLVALWHSQGTNLLRDCSKCVISNIALGTRYREAIAGDEVPWLAEVIRKWVFGLLF